MQDDTPALQREAGREGGRGKERGEGEGVTERIVGEIMAHHYLLRFRVLPLLLPVILTGLNNPSYNPMSWGAGSRAATKLAPYCLAGLVHGQDQNSVDR